MWGEEGGEEKRSEPKVEMRSSERRGGVEMRWVEVVSSS